MTILLFKTNSNQVSFKFKEEDKDYLFDENGVFKYIDSIITNEYKEIVIEYDKEDKELQIYADLLHEIYNEILDPKNKFAETYNKYLEASKVNSSTTEEIEKILENKGTKSQ